MNTGHDTTVDYILEQNNITQYRTYGSLEPLFILINNMFINRYVGFKLMTLLQLSAEQNSSNYNYYRNSREKYITKAHIRANICVYETQLAQRQQNTCQCNIGYYKS